MRTEWSGPAQRTRVPHPSGTSTNGSPTKSAFTAEEMRGHQTGRGKFGSQPTFPQLTQPRYSPGEREGANLTLARIEHAVQLALIVLGFPNPGLILHSNQHQCR